MSWKQFLFSPRGRIGRRAFWFRFALPWFLLLIAPTVLLPLPSPEVAAEMYEEWKRAVESGSVLQMLIAQGPVAWITFGFFYASLWSFIVVCVKRCHDRGWPGWLLLIVLVPLIGPLWLLLELGFLRGTVGANRFGADPRDAGSSAFSDQA